MTDERKIRKNMEKFDLKQVRRGAAVCTRDGRNATVLCTTRKGEYPVVAMVENGDVAEIVETFARDGKVYVTGRNRDMDLMIKREGSASPDTKVSGTGRREGRRKRLYVSGKMTGLEYEQYQRVFAATAEAFEDEYEVVNPAKFIWCRWQWLWRQCLPDAR